MMTERQRLNWLDSLYERATGKRPPFLGVDASVKWAGVRVDGIVPFTWERSCQTCGMRAYRTEVVSPAGVRHWAFAYGKTLCGKDCTPKGWVWRV